MAKQQHGINDGYCGTVGTVIGYMWRGKWCLRSHPRKVHNPRTPLQQEGRTLFGIASSLAAGFSSALRLGLQQASLRQGMTSRNLFISFNRSAIHLVDGVAGIDYPSLVVASGPVAPVAFGNLSIKAPAGSNLDAGVALSVPFERNPLHMLTDSTDEVYLYAWCPAANAGVLSQPVFRRTCQATITLPSDWTGLEVHFYGFVVDYAGRASASSYLGSVPSNSPATPPVSPVESQRAVSPNPLREESQRAASQQTEWYTSAPINIKYCKTD